jgi:hypothetical protein
MGARFQAILLPTGEQAYIPEDIVLEFPRTTEVGDDRLHLLAQIPWQSKYLARVPGPYRRFFKAIHKYLGMRTTHVHTATSAMLLEELIAECDQKVDESVAYLGLLLHDSGWSRVSLREIADSLDYSGLSHSGEEVEIAREAKAKHDRLGAEIAQEVLAGHTRAPQVSFEQREYICTIVRQHTYARHYVVDGVVPLELQLVHEADRLWSYSHENFWQDTIRKHVNPQTYAKNLAEAIENYFLTEAARVKARRLLLDREEEVADLYSWLERTQDVRVSVLFAT